VGIYSQRFKDRVAVITGGASGVGYEVGARITAEGGRVSLWDRDAANLRKAATQIEGAHIASVDVSDADQVARQAEAAYAALGRIDILVASAESPAPPKRCGNTLWMTGGASLTSI